jgi:NitT/TauT family transport system substrate-binding protein
MNRAALIAATATSLVTMRTARAQTLESIHVASNPVADVVPLLYAQSSGLFRNNGLDVTVQKASNGSAVAAALAGGAIQFGKVASTTIVSAHAHGVGLTVVFPDRLHTPGAQSQTQIIVSPESTIRNGRDLNGKTVAVSAVKDSTWIGARMFVDTAGGDSTTVRFIEIPFSAVGAAVAAGRVDAGVDNAPYLEQDVSSGKVRALGDIFGMMGSNFLETAWVANADYIAKNAQTVARFARAIREAQVWCNAHPSEANELTAKFTGVDRAALDATKTIFATEMDPRTMQSYVAAAAKYQVIPRPFDAAELFART